MSISPVCKETVLEQLRQVMDPELGCNIVDLGLVYSIVVDGSKVAVSMTLTTPGCPMHESIRQGAESAVLSMEGVADAAVELVWDPPWHPSMMTTEGRAMTGITL
jgi:metal-sulfur cluster biosynthetic enzyme